VLVDNPKDVAFQKIQYKRSKKNKHGSYNPTYNPNAGQLKKVV